MSDLGVSSASMVGGSGVWDSQTFGAAVVSRTLDTMNGVSSSSMQAAPWDKQTFGAAVVSKTLDYMNSPGLGGSGNSGSSGWSGSMSADYDFQKSVLGAAYSGKGVLFDGFA
ncbi:hypothetical protein DA2_3713 [Desulfovibrio sp. A2]|nr:hypothetical protein DA2_3713 [Desulfovibrio sp. A2]